MKYKFKTYKCVRGPWDGQKFVTTANKKTLVFSVGKYKGYYKLLYFNNTAQWVTKKLCRCKASK